MEAQVYNLNGEVVDTLELSDYIFGIVPNVPVLHQAVLRQQANARLGTHNTRTRADVRGGGRKPYRQKGTGNARQGSRRSPQFRGGGVVFGPHPRSYEQAMPRKMRRLAMRSALSAKAQEGQIIIIESFDELEPRTKAMLTVLESLNLNGTRTLLMLPERLENVYRAAGNITDCKLSYAQYLSLVDMLKYERILMTLGSLDAIDFLADDGEPVYTIASGGDKAKSQKAVEDEMDEAVEDEVELEATPEEDAAAVEADEVEAVPTDEVEKPKRSRRKATPAASADEAESEA